MPEETILGGENEGVMPETTSEKPVGTEKSQPGMSQEQEVHIEGAVERSQGKYNEILAKVASNATHTHTDDDVASDVRGIDALTDEESKVQQLLDLAGAKGVAYAVKVARALEDYYVLDRMHDDLADKLYVGLLERGLIQKD